MSDKTLPIALDDDRLDEATGGADGAQRSRVTSLTVTFDATVTFDEGDPDKPIIAGQSPNPGR